MDVILQHRIKSDSNYINYLRSHSYWYKYLNRTALYFKDFENEMKTEYKLTFQDKVDSFTKNIDKISRIIDIFS